MKKDKKDINKEVADKLRTVDAKKERINASLFGLYSVHNPKTDGLWVYTPPFIAKDDDTALEALKELAKTVKEIQKKNVYCVGTFCAYDGKITSIKPRLVINKK